MSAESEALRRWTAEPHVFVRQVIGAEPDEWQDKLLKEMPQHSRIAIAGSKGCAKTAFEAWALWWSMTTQPGCNIGAVSISGENLRDGLWKEAALWQAKAPLLQALFKWSPERIVRKTEPGTWFASARTYNRAADPNAQAQSLAGLHGRFVTFIIDEAGGVPLAVVAAADAALATGKPGHQLRVIVGGNTTSPKGGLHHVVTKQRHLWHCVRITSDPDDPMRTPRVSAEWARQQIKLYGRDNPWVKINVFAEFPEQAVGKLLSLSEAEAASERKVEENRREPLVLGVDVGQVTDAAVIYARRGRLLYDEPIVMRGKNSIFMAGEIIRVAKELGAVTVFIDVGGPGIGVFDQMRALGFSTVVPVWFGGGADDDTRYANKRTEMHVRIAEWIRGGGAIGRATELIQDLCEPELGWNVKGQQLLEPKEHVRDRLGRSPDWGDAAALTFAYPVAPVISGEEGVYREISRVMQEKPYSEPGFGSGSDRGGGW